VLIMSDSSAELIFIDPSTWREVKRVTVRDSMGQPVTWVNELEWVHGKLLANHFMSQELLVINPDTGVIEEYFDIADLNPSPYPKCKCQCGPPTSNGIAYDPVGDRLFITGKDWQAYYLVRLTFANGKVIGDGSGMRSD
jgi:glutamine cyclotransferase